MLILLALTVVQRVVGFGRSVLLCRWLDPGATGPMGPGLWLPGRWPRRWPCSACPARSAATWNITASADSCDPSCGRRPLFTAALTLVAVVGIGLASGWFSQLIFGRDDCVHLVRLLGRRPGRGDCLQRPDGAVLLTAAVPAGVDPAVRAQPALRPAGHDAGAVVAQPRPTAW